MCLHPGFHVGSLMLVSGDSGSLFFGGKSCSMQNLICSLMLVACRCLVMPATVGGSRRMFCDCGRMFCHGRGNVCHCGRMFCHGRGNVLSVVPSRHVSFSFFPLLCHEGPHMNPRQNGGAGTNSCPRAEVDFWDDLARQECAISICTSG